jgi:heme exporter protein C
MIWGKQAWGEWWTWSPRLTFSLILWLLYAGFLVLRPMVSTQRRAAISSVYGIVAFLDVPLVYLSVKILPDVHPSSIAMDPTMKRTLLLCIVAAFMLAGGFVWSRVWSRQGRAGTGAGTTPLPAVPLRSPRIPPRVVH